MSYSRRTSLIALGIVVAMFVALYPYFGAMDFCERGECPYAMTQSSSGSVAACASAVLAALSAAVLAPALRRGRRVFAANAWLTQFHLAPDSPPPRFSSFQAA